MEAHDVVCVHTMVGFLAGTESMFHQDGWSGTESHFGVGGPADGALDGTVYQWVDTDDQADANLQGNHRLISIETSDGGDETNPWSDAQLDAITSLVVWACRTHDIPAELIADSAPGRRGIGYHRQGIDPWRVAGGEKWSNANGKVCPGDVRIAQLVDVVVPRVQARVGGSGPVSSPLTLDVISPDTGAAGDQVVLTGSGFSTADGVSFAGSWVGHLEHRRATPGSPRPCRTLSGGTVAVVVSTPDATSEGAVVHLRRQPGRDALDAGADRCQSRCRRGGGCQVVLSGTGFSAANGVSFGDVWVWRLEASTATPRSAPPCPSRSPAVPSG